MATTPATYVYAKSKIHSSVVKNIAVGSIRTPKSRDVIFAKETVLELLDLGDDGRLTSVLEQPVFGTIKDMKLLHCNFPDPTDPSTAPSLDAPKHASRVHHTPPPKPPVNGDDLLVLTSDSGVLSFVSFHVPSPAAGAETPEVVTNPWSSKTAVVVDRKGKGKAVAEPVAPQRPPEKAVYSLEEASRYGRFTIIKEISLSPPGVNYKDLGHILCIDPLSRAIAVTALQDCFKVLLLHPRLSRTRFEPIKERYDFTQEGIIWQASFLYPNPMKQERVLLAIMVFNDVDKCCHVVIYEFLTTDALARATVYAKLPLAKDSPLPLHIVPLPRYPECFLIINEREACFIRTEEAASGLTHFPKFPLPTLTREFGDVDGVQYPHITATALPIDQEPSVADTTQRLYAGTSGGLVYCIDVAEGPSVEFGLLGKRNPVGAAMCVVASGPGFVGEEELEAQAEDGEEDEERGDVIVYAGEMADGEVVLARPTRLHLSTLQTITNHAPVLDFAVLDPRGERCDSVFTCSGRGPRHGTVREVRNGIGVVVLHRSEPECDGVTGLWSLRNRPAENWDEFLVVSFASETRVMNIGAGDLDDITDTSGFDAHASTLAAATLAAGEYDVARGGYLLQVHGGGVVVARPAVARAEDPDEDFDSMVLSRIPVSYRWMPSGTDAHVSLAAIVGRFVVMCLAMPERGHVVVSLKVDVVGDTVTFTESGRAELDVEPCFISCMSPVTNAHPWPICIVGTYLPSIKFLSLQDDGLSFLHEEMLAAYAVEGTNIPESSAMLGGERLYFLAGLREGTVICFEWTWDAGADRPLLQNPFVRRLGTLPIRLVPSSAHQHSQRYRDPLGIPEGSILALSDRVWRVTLARAGLSFTAVSFDGREQVMAATPFAFNDASPGTRATAVAERYMIVADRCLNFVQLDHFKRHNVRTIKIKDTPRRILYDKNVEKLLVACTKEGAPFPTSVIKVVDPISGTILHEEKLRDRENVYSMFVTRDERVHRYICIGTGTYSLPGTSAIPGRGQQHHRPIPPPPEKGRIIIYSLRPSKHAREDGKPEEEKAKYEMRTVWQEDDLKGAVYAICSFPQSHLLVASGKILHLYHLDPVRQKLTEVTHEVLRYPVSSLSARGTCICVGSDQDSLSFYRYDSETQKLEFVKSDKRHRLTMDSIMLTENLAVGTDKAGSVFALGRDPADTSFERRLCPTFTFHHPELIPRLRTGTLTYRTPEAPIGPDKFAKIMMEWSDPLSNEPSLDALIGCSLLGTVLLLVRISAVTYELLNVLQEAMKDWESTRPLLGASHTRHRSVSAPSSNAVDGDLVTAFLRMRTPEQERLVVGAAGGLMKVAAKFLLEEMKEGRRDSGAADGEMEVNGDRERMAVDGEAGTEGQEISVKKIVEVIEKILEELNEMRS